MEQHAAELNPQSSSCNLFSRAAQCGTLVLFAQNLPVKPDFQTKIPVP
jgi:hypothetical protein